MSLLGRIRWLFFALYLALFLTVPPALLWKEAGLIIGLIATFLLLYWLRVDGTNRIRKRLGVTKLTFAEAPQAHALVEEYCRRLKMPKPQLGYIDTSAINFASFGFTKQKSHLILTRGALESLRPAELSALLAREITVIDSGVLSGHSWLCQFFSLLDRIVGEPQRPANQRLRRQYSVEMVLKQILLYPLTLLPSVLLKSQRSAQTTDLKSLKLSRRPEALSEALRFLDAMKERNQFPVAFSTRHLFLIAPPTKDPLVRIFFDSEELQPRIGNLDKLQKVIGS